MQGTQSMSRQNRLSHHTLLLAIMQGSCNARSGGTQDPPGSKGVQRHIRSATPTQICEWLQLDHRALYTVSHHHTLNHCCWYTHDLVWHTLPSLQTEHVNAGILCSSVILRFSQLFGCRQLSRNPKLKCFRDLEEQQTLLPERAVGYQ